MPTNRRLFPLSHGLVILALSACGWMSARADEFDQLDGRQLSEILKSKNIKTSGSFGFGELEALTGPLKSSRAPLLVVRTEQGNLARLLVSPAYRKPPSGKGAPIPVLALERFDTFDAGNLASRLAHGKDVLLFAGFEFDLDSGQVVPAGQGGDLRFEASAPGSERLVSLDEVSLNAVVGPIPGTEPRGAKTSVGRSVLPSDFVGRYRLHANGQWSGLLELKVDEARGLSGTFRSDLNGTAYTVRGEVGNPTPQRARFIIEYPRTEQEYEAFLWTEGKGAMAGTLTMLDRVYGFFAIREGGEAAATGDDVTPLPKLEADPNRKTVLFQKGQYQLDGAARTDQELIDTLKRSLAVNPKTWVLLKVPSDEPFSAVNSAFETLGAAGISNIRLAPADLEY